MYSFICIQIVSGGLYAVIKLNVALKALEWKLTPLVTFPLSCPLLLSLSIFHFTSNPISLFF